MTDLVNPEAILTLFIRGLAVFLLLPFHEYAHAYVAHRLGDNTAEREGRLTVNPFAHLDIIGSLCILLSGFGWAKPVPVNPMSFKNPKKGMALTAVAGPITNLLQALLFMVLHKLMYIILLALPQSIEYYTAINIFDALGYVFYILTVISISLAVFNLVPIPPLDGSRIMGLFLPDKAYYGLMRYERYFMFGMFIILSTGILSAPLSIVNNFVYGILDFCTSFLDMIGNMLAA